MFGNSNHISVETMDAIKEVLLDLVVRATVLEEALAAKGLINENDVAAAEMSLKSKIKAEIDLEVEERRERQQKEYEEDPSKILRDLVLGFTEGGF